MLRPTCALLVVLAFLLSPAQGEPVTPPPARASASEPPAAMMAEILKIRRATQNVDPAEEAEFMEALQGVAGVKKAGQVSAAAATEPASPPAEQKPATQNTANHDELVKCLREAARRLDEVAANYEERDQYPLAAEARKRAEALRSDARSLKLSTLSFFMTFER